MDRRQSLTFLLETIVLSCFPGMVYSNISNKPSLEAAKNALNSHYSDLHKAYKLNNDPVLIVDGLSQSLYLVGFDEGFKIQKQYPVSTSKYGFGFRQGSGRTPTGVHKIAEKFGHDAKKGSIFVNSINTGKIARVYIDDYDSENDHITSRIMWLAGCEEENSNTYRRHIYIHGTPEEGLIGKPASHGCIRMKNDDVIDLFSIVNVNAYVLIKENIAEHVHLVSR